MQNENNHYRVENVELKSKLKDKKQDHESEIKAMKFMIKEKEDMLNTIEERERYKEQRLLETNRGLLSQLVELRKDNELSVVQFTAD